jgi:hypothetical protein
VAGFIGMFNSIHFWIRWRGLRKSVLTGAGVVQWVQSLHLQAWAAQLRRVGLLLVTVLLLAYFARWKSSDVLLWMVAVLLVSVTLKRWALSGFTIFYLVCAASVGMVFFGIHG